LNLALIAKKHATDEHFAETLAKQKYTATMREGVKLYVHHKTQRPYTYLPLYVLSYSSGTTPPYSIRETSA
jgi:hypothetical protein